MKVMKMFLFTLILFVSISVFAENIEIILDACGRLQNSDPTKGNTFSAGMVKLIFKINVLPLNECGIDANDYYFVLELKEEMRKTEMEPIYSGQIEIKDANVYQVIEVGSIELIRPGTVYQVSVIRYKTSDFCLRQNPVTIFSRGFKTKSRYYLGFHVAFLLPMESVKDYKLTFEAPEDVYPSIIETESRSPYMILYGAIYPWGFEPDLTPKKAFLRRLHFDIGFELTKNIFKTIYLGCGYNVVNYVSLNVFIAYGKFDQLREGFVVGPMTNEKIKEVPLDQQTEWRVGLGFSMPIDFMVSFLGRILNIK